MILKIYILRKVYNYWDIATKWNLEEFVNSDKEGGSAIHPHGY